MCFERKWRPVMARPLKSSVSRKLPKKSLTVVAALMAGDSVPDVPGRLDPQAHDDEPDQGDRDEDLPAQPHDLVVAVARERGAHPQEHGDDDEDLDREPDPARDEAEEVERGQPAA